MVHSRLSLAFRRESLLRADLPNSGQDGLSLPPESVSPGAGSDRFPPPASERSVPRSTRPESGDGPTAKENVLGSSPVSDPSAGSSKPAGSYDPTRVWDQASKSRGDIAGQPAMTRKLTGAEDTGPRDGAVPRPPPPSHKTSLTERPRTFEAAVLTQDDGSTSPGQPEGNGNSENRSTKTSLDASVSLEKGLSSRQRLKTGSTSLDNDPGNPRPLSFKDREAESRLSLGRSESGPAASLASQVGSGLGKDSFQLYRSATFSSLEDSEYSEGAESVGMNADEEAEDAKAVPRKALAARQVWLVSETQKHKELEARVSRLLLAPVPKVPPPRRGYRQHSPLPPSSPGFRPHMAREDALQSRTHDESTTLPWEPAAADASQEPAKRSRDEAVELKELLPPRDANAYYGMLETYAYAPRETAPEIADGGPLFRPPLHEDIECGEYRPATAPPEWRIDPAKCRVFGAGIFSTKAGVMSQFTIQAVAADGTFIRSGKDISFVVYVESTQPPRLDRARHRVYTSGMDEGPDELYDSDAETKNRYLPPLARSAHRRRKGTQDGHVYDHGDGTFTVTYGCTVSVPHLIHIYYNDRLPVAESPYMVEVEPGATHAGSCVADGAGVETFELGGRVNEIIVQARDPHGNDVKKGGERFTVVGSGAAKIIETSDLQDGRYWVKYYVPSGAERDYVEINSEFSIVDGNPDWKVAYRWGYVSSPRVDVLYHGQPIQGSPFRPKPVHPPQDDKPPAPLFEAVNVINPTESLTTVTNDWLKWIQMGGPPHLSPYPSYPPREEAEEILRKANLDYIPEFEDPSGEHLRGTLDKLLRYYKKLLNRDEMMHEVLKSVTIHGEVGSLHQCVEAGNRKLLKEYIESVAKIQEEMDMTYKSIQHGVIDCLPVAFEIEDPDAIREMHKKRREHLLATHKALERKEQELRQRENRFKTERLKLVSAMADDLAQRREALEVEKAALKENTSYVLRLTQLSLKKHLRREMLSACERDPVEAFKSKTWQRDFSRMLLETPTIHYEKVDVAKMGPNKEMEEQEEPEAAPAVDPDDPTRPATWLSRGEFLLDRPSTFGPQKAAESVRVKHLRALRESAKGNATCVSLSVRDHSGSSARSDHREHSRAAIDRSRTQLSRRQLGEPDRDFFEASFKQLPAFSRERPGFEGPDNYGGSTVSGPPVSGSTRSRRSVRFGEAGPPDFPASALPDEFSIAYPGRTPQTPRRFF
ncbi:filamin abp280 repeat-containing protein [Cystoisospora suis]|uniref:Filamin abp280 repeat-containing protein n=1 Tax=Cystoisospora suis TaxID=483139 RepID=A0A2C6LF95_9APIC|nr:filamin abp280 repeat-containing protein [Cystoisospora suis]